MEDINQNKDNFVPQNKQESIIVSCLKEKYQFIEKIGKSNFFNVYKVINKKLDRTEALKVLSSELTADEEFLSRFEVEAKVCASFDHSNIVTIYEFGRADPFFYFTMFYVDGYTLSKYVKAENAIDEKKICNIIIKVSTALQYAHNKGVIHRDIKPQNILLDETDRPYITDFGIAKSDNVLTHTKTGLFMGSPYYVSPEQVEGKPVDKRADIYSLGVTLYALLTHQHPFSGDTAISIIAKRLTQEPTPPITYKPNLDDRLNRIIRKTLQKNPENRYQSANEFAQDLHNFLQNRPINAPPIPSRKKEQKEKAKQPIKHHPPSKKGRMKFIPVLITSIVVMGIFVLLYIFTTNWVNPEIKDSLALARSVIQKENLTESEIDTAIEKVVYAKRLDPSYEPTQTLLKELQDEKRKLHNASIEKKLSLKLQELERQYKKKNYILGKQLAIEGLDILRQLPKEEFKQFISFDEQFFEYKNKTIEKIKLGHTHALDQTFKESVKEAKKTYYNRSYFRCIALASETLDTFYSLPPEDQKPLKQRIRLMKEIKKTSETVRTNFKKTLDDTNARIINFYNSENYPLTIHLSNGMLKSLNRLYIDEQIDYGDKKKSITTYKKKAIHYLAKQQFNALFNSLMADTEKKNIDKEKYFAGIEAAIIAQYADRKESMLITEKEDVIDETVRDKQKVSMQRINDLMKSGAYAKALILIENAIYQPDGDQTLESPLKKLRLKAIKNWK